MSNTVIKKQYTRTFIKEFLKYFRNLDDTKKTALSKNLLITYFEKDAKSVGKGYFAFISKADLLNLKPRYALSNPIDISKVFQLKTQDERIEYLFMYGFKSLANAFDSNQVYNKRSIVDWNIFKKVTEDSEFWLDIWENTSENDDFSLKRPNKYMLVAQASVYTINMLVLGTKGKDTYYFYEENSGGTMGIAKNIPNIPVSLDYGGIYDDSVNIDINDLINAFEDNNWLKVSPLVEQMLKKLDLEVTVPALTTVNNLKRINKGMY